MDKISVIVPVWNGERYLRKCIDSIINQTYNNLEIVLIDDGSTDSSLEICKMYAEKDSRIKVYHKENGGQASARNYALDIITGDYVGFVDNDDWIYPDMYEKLYRYMIEYDADIARCVDCSNESEKEVSEVKITVTEQNDFFDLLYQDIWGGHVTDRLFKRSLIGAHRFPQSKTIEDMRFMRLLLPDVRREVSTNEKLFFYTIREDNTSFVYARSHVNSFERAIEFQDRYEEAKRLYPKCEKLLLKKATTYSCGTYRILFMKRKQYRNEYSQIKDFLKKNKKTIIKETSIGLKYRIFIALIV